MTIDEITQSRLIGYWRRTAKKWNRCIQTTHSLPCFGSNSFKLHLGLRLAVWDGIQQWSIGDCAFLKKVTTYCVNLVVSAYHHPEHYEITCITIKLNDEENHGVFKEEKSGNTYKRACLFNEETLCLGTATECTRKCCEERCTQLELVACDSCHWVNNKLLPSSDLPPNLTHTITIRTATCWLNRLGCHPNRHKKGGYVDGQEREDVVAHHKTFWR